MKPIFKVLVVANGAPWASWPTKIAAIEAFYAPIATLKIDLIHTALTPPFQNFIASGTQYEAISGMVSQIDPTWYANNITPLGKGYDITLLVCPESEWPLLDCIRGTTTLGTARPIPCEIASDENEATYLNGIELFPTAEHYMEHELAHALFELAGIAFASDTTHYWDFAEKNLPGVLADIKFTTMETGPTAENPDVLYPTWTPQSNAYHNVRVLCDLAGLSLEKTIEIDGAFYSPKDIICACIYQESQFIPSAVGKPNSNGTVDYGICQFNNGELNGIPLWIGPNAQFPSTDFVLANPEACVNEMIAQYKLGHIGWWSSYSTGAFKQWLLSTSPMWKL